MDRRERHHYRAHVSGSSKQSSAMEDSLASSSILERDELRLSEGFLGHRVVWYGLFDRRFPSITC